MVVGGLRGQAYLSTDRGDSWQPVDKPETGAIVAMQRLADDTLLMVAQSGRLFTSKDNGASFTEVAIDQPRPASGVVEVSPGVLVLVGATGARRIELGQV